MNDTLHEPQKLKSGLLEAIWDTLGNLKFVVALLLIFTAATLLGTFIPQGEPQQQYVATYGTTRAHILQSLQLTDLYHSGWYRFLIVVLTASVLVCTVNRYKLTVRRSRVDEGDFGPERVESMRASRAIQPGTASASAAGRISSALRRLGYRVRSHEEERRTCLVADRGRTGNWGMFVLHASLLLIAVGALVGASLGFTGYTMWVAEGESSSDCTRRDYSHMVQAENPHNAGQQMLQPYLEHKSLPFSIHLDRFRIGISKKGSPTAYESTVRVLQKGKVAKRFTIATNRPLRYRGISFYQNDFSMASVTIKMAGPDGKETLATWPVQEMPGGGGGRIYRVVPSDAAKITTPDGTIFVIPAGLAPNYDPELPWEIPSRGDLPANPAVFLFAHPMRGDSMAGMQMPEEIGWVSKSQSQKFSGYTFSLDRAQLESALGVTRNPGMPIVYVGFMALVLGLVFAFYVRHRIIRVCLCDEGGQSRVAIGGTERLGEADFDREFGRIEQALSAREGS